VFLDLNKYPLVNAAKESFKQEVSPDEDNSVEEEQEKEKIKAYRAQFRELLHFLDKRLKGKVARAEPSDNLVRTPCAVLAGPGGYTANLEKLLKAQPSTDPSRVAALKAQRILQINPKHPLILELNRIVKEELHDSSESSENYQESHQTAVDLSDLLFETATLQSGYSIDDPTLYARRVYKMMKLSLRLNFDPEAFELEQNQQQNDEQEHKHEHDEL